MVKIAIVGAGGIANQHVEAIKGINDANIVAVVDVIKEKADHLADLCDATAYENMDECLPQADMVYILTPPSFHKELAIKAIGSGKHVVVEKPIAINIEDAEAMVEAARKAEVKLMTAFNMRFRKGFIRLKKTIQSGKLGEIVNFWSQRLGIGVGPGTNWRTTKGLLCGMSIESLSHDIDLIRWLLGEITDVRAKIFESRKNLPGFDDNANIVFSLANGGIATIHASWSSNLDRNSRGVIGTKGTAIIDGNGLWDLTHFHLKTSDMENEIIEVINDKLDVKSYREESKHFIDCVENNRQPTITGEDGLLALRISHAILTSHRENRVVPVSGC
ncbi:Gfo/Idh/MocA family oxidoreductase [bacterium]|nr:Gfo/Idh/MocA family oxidoreductase [bacterium]